MQEQKLGVTEISKGNVKRWWWWRSHHSGIWPSSVAPRGLTTVRTQMKTRGARSQTKYNSENECETSDDIKTWPFIHATAFPLALFWNDNIFRLESKDSNNIVRYRPGLERWTSTFSCPLLPSCSDLSCGRTKSIQGCLQTWSNLPRWVVSLCVFSSSPSLNDFLMIRLEYASDFCHFQRAKIGHLTLSVSVPSLPFSLQLQSSWWWLCLQQVRFFCVVCMQLYSRFHP